MSINEPIAFTLTAHDGRRVPQRSFPGRHSIVFFGFTHCRTVCPRALDRLEAALDLLGEDAVAYQPLYITVDPDRDDAARLREYLRDRPRILGLTGSAEALAGARAAFHAFARRKDDPEAPDGYVVPHTAFTFVVDDAGRRTAHIGDAATAHEVAEVLRDALRASAAIGCGTAPASSHVESPGHAADVDGPACCAVSDGVATQGPVQDERESAAWPRPDRSAVPVAWGAPRTSRGPHGTSPVDAPG